MQKVAPQTPDPISLPNSPRISPVSEKSDAIASPTLTAKNQSAYSDADGQILSGHMANVAWDSIPANFQSEEDYNVVDDINYVCNTTYGLMDSLLYCPKYVKLSEKLANGQTWAFTDSELAIISNSEKTTRPIARVQCSSSYENYVFFAHEGGDGKNHLCVYEARGADCSFSPNVLYDEPIDGPVLSLAANSQYIIYAVKESEQVLDASRLDRSLRRVTTNLDAADHNALDLENSETHLECDSIAIQILDAQNFQPVDKFHMPTVQGKINLCISTLNQILLGVDYHTFSAVFVWEMTSASHPVSESIQTERQLVKEAFNCCANMNDTTNLVPLDVFYYTHDNLSDRVQIQLRCNTTKLAVLKPSSTVEVRTLTDLSTASYIDGDFVDVRFAEYRLILLSSQQEIIMYSSCLEPDYARDLRPSKVQSISCNRDCYLSIFTHDDDESTERLTYFNPCPQYIESTHKIFEVENLKKGVAVRDKYIFVDSSGCINIVDFHTSITQKIASDDLFKGIFLCTDVEKDADGYEECKRLANGGCDFQKNVIVWSESKLMRLEDGVLTDLTIDAIDIRDIVVCQDIDYRDIRSTFCVVSAQDQDFVAQCYSFDGQELKPASEQKKLLANYTQPLPIMTLMYDEQHDWALIFQDHSTGNLYGIGEGGYINYNSIEKSKNNHILLCKPGKEYTLQVPIGVFRYPFIFSNNEKSITMGANRARAEMILEGEVGEILDVEGEFILKSNGVNMTTIHQARLQKLWEREDTNWKKIQSFDQAFNFVNQDYISSYRLGIGRDLILGNSHTGRLVVIENPEYSGELFFEDARRMMNNREVSYSTLLKNREHLATGLHITHLYAHFGQSAAMLEALKDKIEFPNTIRGRPYDAKKMCYAEHLRDRKVSSYETLAVVALYAIEGNPDDPDYEKVLDFCLEHEINPVIEQLVLTLLHKTHLASLNNPEHKVDRQELKKIKENLEKLSNRLTDLNETKIPSLYKIYEQLWVSRESKNIPISKTQILEWYRFQSGEPKLEKEDGFPQQVNVHASALYLPTNIRDSRYLAFISSLLKTDDEKVLQTDMIKVYTDLMWKKFTHITIRR